MRKISAALALFGLIILLSAVVGLYWAVSGRVNVAADAEHAAPVAYFLKLTSSRAITRQARDVQDQMPDMDDQEILYEAIVAYEDMCAKCHTPPGQTVSALARGLNPAAPNLTASAYDRFPSELFLATKHGIRMTGMPAWGPTHTDKELWAIVGLIRQFPEFTGSDYADLLAEAQSAGVEHTHDNDHHHEHDNHGGQTSEKPENSDTNHHHTH